MSDKPLVVLDTNVVLDWLVFHDASVLKLTQQIERGELLWIACPAMRSELAHMLNHHRLARWGSDAEQALAVFDRWAEPQRDPPEHGGVALRCTDPDDQVFLNLALAGRASWLFTHDRALLKLARRARPLGLSIQPP